MRVTSNTFSSQFVDQLGRLTARQTQLQLQAASGQRIQNPDDDPVAAQRALNIQAEARAVSQFQSNISREQNIATLNFGALKSLKKISDRAGEIATLADGLKSPEELKTFAAEVSELIKQGVQLMNTKNGSSYLFGGTANDRAPFALSSDASGQPSSVAYDGNGETASVEIAEGVTFTAQVVGVSGATGADGVITDAASGADFFQHLIALRNHLSSGDVASVASNDRANLGKDEDNIIYHLGLNGAIQARLEAADSTASDRTLALEQRISKEMDADLAQTLTELSQAQTAYQAALQSGAKILSVSLLDYLR